MMDLSTSIKTIVLMLIGSGVVLLIVLFFYYIAVLFESWELRQKKKNPEEISIDKLENINVEKINDKKEE